MDFRARMAQHILIDPATRERTVAVLDAALAAGTLDTAAHAHARKAAAAAEHLDAMQHALAGTPVEIAPSTSPFSSTRWEPRARRELDPDAPDSPVELLVVGAGLIVCVVAAYAVLADKLPL